MTRSNAIVCLTRGYSELSGYIALIKRNRSIYEVINRHRERQYPLIIWHEGNIPREHQYYVLDQECNDDVRFVNISRVFRLPRTIKEEDLAERWRVGYRLMCRFNFYHIWKYTKAFKYVMRLDEDCVLLSSKEDPIEALSNLQGDFAAPLFTEETHELTNQSLSAFVQEFADVHGSLIAKPYNQIFPYTNCYVTRTAFWREQEVQNFLDAVRKNRDSICLRWGDLPVLGAALNMFAAPDKVHRFSEIRYWHGSHHTTVGSDTALPM